MSIKRKCEHCDKTTYRSLSDFCTIGWSAWKTQTRNSVAKCYCPNHQKEFKKECSFFIEEELSQ